jgi:hypothetical protein
MRSCADFMDLAHDECSPDVARILAVGVRRLRSRTLIRIDPREQFDPENRTDSTRDSLEFFVSTRLRVHGC